jgi:branched-chain amino acid aminotransferase
MLSGIKSLSYGESAQGMRLAAQKGCDDLLYFNEKNEVVEFGLANILIERDGKFFTPTLESGALAGVVRGILLEWFSSISEAVLTREDLKAAEGVYVISSLREIVLVSELHWQNGDIDKYRISADAEKLRTQYLINSRSNPNS